MSSAKTDRSQSQPPQRRKLVRKEVSLHLRVTKAQKENLAAAATRAGLGVSTWLLMLGLRAARNDE